MIRLPDEAATEALGAALARVLAPGDAIALYGTLGAGKTTLARGLLRALGHEGDVASPTFPIASHTAMPSTGRMIVCGGSRFWETLAMHPSTFRRRTMQQAIGARL